MNSSSYGIERMNSRYLAHILRTEFAVGMTARQWEYRTPMNGKNEGLRYLRQRTRRADGPYAVKPGADYTIGEPSAVNCLPERAVDGIHSIQSRKMGYGLGQGPMICSWYVTL